MRTKTKLLFLLPILAAAGCGGVGSHHARKTQGAGARLTGNDPATAPPLAGSEALSAVVPDPNAAPKIGTTSAASDSATSAAPIACAAVASDQPLAVGQSLPSCDGFFQLMVQSDGNVVLYERRDGEVAALWSTQTVGEGVSAVFQGDGNFVVYDKDKHSLFQTGTGGKSGLGMRLQDDGNLVIADGATAVWSSGTSRAIGRGLQFPIPIDPAVRITDGQFLVDLYQIVLNRRHDADGLRTHREKLEAASTHRADVLADFVTSTEFTASAELRDKDRVIDRAFKTLLKRPASAEELEAYRKRLRDETGKGQGDLAWLDFIEGVYASPEYKLKQCHTSYYLYGEKINDSALSLRHLFSQNARLPQIDESEPIHFDFSGSAVASAYDQKLPMVKDGDGYLGFTRGDTGNGAYNIFALSTTDGRSFKNISGAGIFRRDSGANKLALKQFYDPHVSIDYSTCPPRYVMAMECGLPGEVGVPSLCSSFTTTPGLPETWSTPTLVVRGLARNTDDPNWEKSERFLSASTGVTLHDGRRKYLKWTELDDGTRNFLKTDGSLEQDEGFERAQSKGAEVPDFSHYLSSTQEVSTLVLGSQPSVTCQGEWDCNNRDVQDWKIEDGQYYAIYNGANYYRCVRPDPSQGTSNWAISVSRSTAAVGGAQEALGADQTIKALRNDTCGISYPMVNAFQGELYVYYAYKDKAGSSEPERTARGALKKIAK